jgi:hypothetical protein
VPPAIPGLFQVFCALTAADNAVMANAATNNDMFCFAVVMAIVRLLQVVEIQI